MKKAIQTNKSILTLSTALILLVVLGTACAGPANPQVYTDQDASKTIELKAGASFQVVLDGNPTTGYMWELDPSSSAPVKQSGDAAFKADSQATGSGGKLTFTFQATGAGQGTLKLVYHRSWEKNAPPEKTFEMTVVVK